MRLQGKVALLTAAAGAGIGQATARMLAQEGAHVVVSDMHPDRPRQLAEAIAQETGVAALGLQCDVTQRAQVDALVQRALERFGRIDILFNNAGTNRPAPVAEMTDEAWGLIMDTCLRGTFYCCRAVLPGMMERKGGRIVNIASTAAFTGLQHGHAAYAAAKAGVIAFTRCLAMEAAPHYITANVIAPGFIFNEFIPRLYPSEEIERMNRSIPYPRKGVPEDIGHAVVFLCSDEGEYITGQTLCVSGGSWMH